MSTTNGENDSLLGKTVLPPELGQFFGALVFFGAPFRTMTDTVIETMTVAVIFTVFPIPLPALNCVNS